MRLLRALAMLVVGVLLAGGLAFASPPTASAKPNIDNIFAISNWKHNNKNIRMCGGPKKNTMQYCANVKPGQASGDYARQLRSYKVRHVWIPSGCYGTWTKSVSASVYKKRMKGGQWHKVSNLRATYRHSTIYLWGNKNPADRWCNKIYR